jgi:hypothetical protein
VICTKGLANQAPNMRLKFVQSPLLLPVAIFSHGGGPSYKYGRASQSFKLELDFWLVVELGYLAVALPKLNIVAVNKLLCLPDVS